MGYDQEKAKAEAATKGSGFSNPVGGPTSIPTAVPGQTYSTLPSRGKSAPKTPSNS